MAEQSTWTYAEDALLRLWESAGRHPAAAVLAFALLLCLGLYLLARARKRRERQAAATRGLADWQQQIVAKVSREKGLPSAVLAGVAAHMAESAPPPLTAERILWHKADLYAYLKTDIADFGSGDEQVAQLHAQALSALEAGDPHLAEQHLFLARDRDLDALQQKEDQTVDRILSAARNSALMAQAAWLQPGEEGYRRAAQRFEEAAALADKVAPKSAFFWREERARVLYELGLDFDADTALEECAALRNALLKTLNRENDAETWGRLQANLGGVLQVLGSKRDNPELLELAAAAYRRAIEEYTREREPVLWATLCNNLGGTLQQFANVSGPEGTAPLLEEAAAAYRNALDEFTRERAPQQWASLQHSLGNVLQALASRGQGGDLLDRAIEHYRDALREYTRENAPREWAMIQNSLGIALSALGERNGDGALLDQAAEAYREAVQEYTRENAGPERRAALINLGIALRRLGELRRDASTLRQAIEVHTGILPECPIERNPSLWAVCHLHIGLAWLQLGGLEDRTACLQKAEESLAAALTHYAADPESPVHDQCLQALHKVREALAR